MFKQYHNGFITEYYFRSPDEYGCHEPISITLAVTAAAIAASASIAAGQAAAQEAAAQKKMAEYNARLMEAEGKARMEAAQQEEKKISKEQELYLGYQKAAFAKQGFSIEEGSSVDVMADTYGEFATDRLLTLRNGLLEQLQLNSSAGLERVRGKVAMQKGRNIRRASYLSAGGSIAGGLSSLDYGSYGSGTGGRSWMSTAGRTNQSPRNTGYERIYG